MGYSDSWRGFFRYDTFRKGQEEAIVSIAKALDDGKKFVIAELPTGIGKSDVAMALAQSAHSAYVITSQNILIEQYKRDFGKLHSGIFHSIKGKRNYKCKSGYEGCDQGEKMSCYQWENHEKDDPKCLYKTERDKTIQAQVGLLNTTYYALAAKNIEMWPMRDLAVVDEAHNLSGEVMNLTEFSLDNYKLKKMRLGCTLPDDFPVEDKAFPNSISTKHFVRFADELKSELDDFMERSQEFAGILSPQELEEIADLASRVGRFQRSIGKGVEWVVDREVGRKSEVKYVARPLSTSHFAQELLFDDQATQFLLQSATIVDFKRYAEELGIPLGVGAAQAIRKPSPFAIGNRLVYAMNTAKMGYKEIDAGLPKIAEAVTEILDRCKNEKGIIHTSSYKVQKYLQETLFDDRLIFPDARGREAALEEHIRRKDASVLVSPSMTEGVDGKHDLVRFQVICKIPYPSLGDRRTHILANRDWGWYNYQTLKTIIQSVGRGVRAEDDWCHTFVLDAGFNTFMDRAKVGGDFPDTIRSSSDGIKYLKSK